MYDGLCGKYFISFSFKLVGVYILRIFIECLSFFIWIMSGEDLIFICVFRDWNIINFCYIGFYKIFVKERFIVILFDKF